MKPIALVTGASGAIGWTLVRRLMQHGYSVRALARSMSITPAVPSGFAIIQADITDRPLICQAVDGAKVVFHLAAKLHLNDISPDLTSEYSRVNIEGTRCLVEAASEAKVERLVFFSTINVYGPTQPGQLFDEDAPLHPDSVYAETKAAAEDIVRRMEASAILRPAAVYGPGMKGNFPRLLEALRKRRPVLVGDGGNRRTLVYVEDLCSAAILAAEHPAAKGQTYNVTDGRVHTLREIINAISAALGQPPSRLRLPKSAVRLAVGLLEDSLKLAGKSSPFSRATVDKLTEDVAVSCDKIQTELGYDPQFDLCTGWAETIKALKQ